MRCSNSWKFSVLGTVLLVGACAPDEPDIDINVERSRTNVTVPAPTPTPGAPTLGYPDSLSGPIQIEVDLEGRELHVLRSGTVSETHPVAVGTSEWPTPTGEWTVHQVVWNPRWIPPKDESWAKNEKETPPGDPENPLGKVQLVYHLPNSIHGTNEPSSIGKAVSHGSIRMSNEVITELAREVMRAGGVMKDEAWFREVEANPTKEYAVDLVTPVPIRVVETSSASRSGPAPAGSPTVAPRDSLAKKP